MTLGSSSRMGSHKISVNAGPHVPSNNCSAALGDSLQRQGLSPPVMHEEGREISPQRLLQERLIVIEFRFSWTFKHSDR